MLRRRCSPSASRPSSRHRRRRIRPAFRAGADLVIVDAVVVDKDGKPVSNLTAADFEVKDEGRPQAVSLFQTVSTAATASLPQGATRRFGYSTNAGVEARPTRAFVLFFDDLHLAQADGDRAKAALAGFIDRELEDGDLVSLVAPGNSLRWHARMPAGRAELERIVRGLKGLFAPDPSFEQMSDYEAYRISAFQDEVVANQVQRRWQNLRVLGKEPTNLATDKGFQPENRGGLIGMIPPDIADPRQRGLPAGRGPQLAPRWQALERTIDGLAAVRGRKAVRARLAGLHRRSGACRRRQARHRRGAPRQRRGLLRRRARPPRRHAVRAGAVSAARSIRATSTPPTPT